MDSVGRYEILGKLGQGGQSIAYKARDPQIDRLVAIKLVRDTDHLTEDGRQEFSVRFFREAQAAGRLSHPNIATIYDIGDDGGRPFIAMEYVEGETLNRLVSRTHPLAPGTVIHLFQQLCAALQYAHDSGVVHRDIKPENIMVTPTGQVKVVDFGVARLPASTLTQDGHLLGTPSYMSPEQVQGHKVDHRSDIFSLGVVLYESLTGERPFEGDHPTTVIFKIVSDQQRPINEINPDLDSRFDAVLTKALSKDPATRYESCLAVSEDLSELADSIPTIPAIRTTSATAVQPSPGGEPTLIEMPPTPSSSEPGVAGPMELLRQQAGLLILGGLFGAVVLVLVLWWAMAGPSEPPQIAEVTPPEPPPIEFLGPRPPRDWVPPEDVSVVEEQAASPEQTQSTQRRATRPAPPPAETVVAETLPTPPDPPPAAVPLSAAELQQRALAAFRSGRYADAATDFEELVRLQANSGEAHYFLGMSLARTAGSPAAVPYLERAVELRPEDPLFRVQLALNLEKAGRGSQAAAHLRRAVILGGHPEFDADSLRDHIVRLESEAELSQLAPYAVDGTHSHFIGGCQGRLSVTRTELSFVTSEQGHSVELSLAELAPMTSDTDRLQLVLPDGKKLNFKIDDPARATRIHELVGQLRTLKPRPE